MQSGAPKLEELLRSNVPPTDIQQCTARELVRVQEEKYREIAAEAEKLARLRDEVYATLYSYKSLVSPARRFPPEIVAEIFKQCTEAAEADQSWVPTLSSKGMPGVLAHICSGWRVVALNTPELWTSVLFTLDEDEPEEAFDIAAQIAHCKLWMERCKGRPFTLELSSVGEDKHVPDLVQDLVMFKSSTLRVLCLEPIYATYLPILGRLPADSFPTLEAFRLKVNHPHDPEVPFSGWRFFPYDAQCLKLAPNLKAVSIALDSAEPRFEVDAFPLPWRQLTNINFVDDKRGSVDPQSFRWVLEHAPHLETCIVALSAGLFASTALTCESLRSLTVRFHANASVNYFEGMKLPRLEKLSMIFSGEPFASLQRVFELQTASGFKLRELALISGSFDEEELVELLDSMPSLEVLDLSFTECVTAELLQALDCSSSSDSEASDDEESGPPLVPRLKEIGLSMMGRMVAEVARALHGLLKSRVYTDGNTHVSKLEKIRMASKNESLWTEFLKEFREQGLEVEFITIKGKDEK